MRLDLHNLTTCHSAQPGTSTHDPTFSAKGALPLLPMKAYPSAASAKQLFDVALYLSCCCSKVRDFSSSHWWIFFRNARRPAPAPLKIGLVRVRWLDIDWRWSPSRAPETPADKLAICQSCKAQNRKTFVIPSIVGILHFISGCVGLTILPKPWLFK